MNEKVAIAHTSPTKPGMMYRCPSVDPPLNIATTIKTRQTNPSTIDGTRRIRSAWAKRCNLSSIWHLAGWAVELCYQGSIDLSDPCRDNHRDLAN
jgi:hypothetical protein